MDDLLLTLPLESLSERSITEEHRGNTFNCVGTET